MSKKHVKYIDRAHINNKTVLLRVDFNVALTKSAKVADDYRIRQSIPTIKYLLSKKNKILLISHLGRPNNKETKLSLKPVVKHLQKLLPKNKIDLVEDFTTEKGIKKIESQKTNEVLMLENIRYYKEEQKNTPSFSKKLASLADVFVNDAFGVSHRENASVTGVAKFVPSYGGLLLKKEIETISKILNNPKKPYVAIIGGAKISTKIEFVDKLLGFTDFLLIGGGVADTMLKAQGFEIGKSLTDKKEEKLAKKLFDLAKKKKTEIVLPLDVVIGNSTATNNLTETRKIGNVPKQKYILDIGPETEARFGSIISEAKTIVWNGPLGYFENKLFRRGTDFIYYAITQNSKALSIVGGGSTLAAISKKEYLEKITHISTGGGAMLEFIEKGTLPGIEALKR
ncbi:MAG: phosphoglycerate kinase [Patescibacteria group bacterium]